MKAKFIRPMHEAEVSCLYADLCEIISNRLPLIPHRTVDRLSKAAVKTIQDGLTAESSLQDRE